MLWGPSAEPMCDGVGRNFAIIARQKGIDGQESGGRRELRWRPGAGGPGRNRYTVQRSIRWLSRTDVRWGPRFCSTAPARVPHSSSMQISLWAGHSVETSAGPRCDRCGGTFQTVARSQVPTVRKRRTEGNAMAAQRAARAGIGTQYNTRDAG
jgi:hypothetical protein